MIMATQKIPEGYKQTDVGVIPEEWIPTLLEGAADIIMGQSPSGASYNKNGVGIPLINGPTEFTEKYPIKIQWTSEPTKYCRNGDVLLCVRGSSTGRMNISDDEYCIGRGVAAIRAKVGVDRPFITYQVSSAVQDILALTTGSTFPNIDGKSIRAIQISLPPLSEQTAIATVLSDTDALIENLEKLIAKKKAIKQGTMQQLLTGKKRLPGFSEEWEIKKLGQVAEIKTGKRNNDDKVEEGEYPFFVRSQQVERINSYSFDGEAILIPGEGNIGSIYHYINGKFDYHQRVYKISNFTEQYSGKFIYLFMSQHFNVHAMKNSVKATVDSLRLPTFQEFEISFPPTKTEQTVIATILSDMDSEIEKLEQKQDKYSMLKAGMMHQLLTGKIRIYGNN